MASTPSREDLSLVDAASTSPFWSVVQKKSFRATEQLEDAVQKERAAFRKILKLVPIEKLVFLDESGCNIALAKRHSWAPTGMRALGVRPVNHGDNITVVGAIRAKGTVAMRSMKGAMNTVRFRHYVRTALAPRLERDDVVVMDNLRAHHGSAIENLIRARGAHVLYLPPYSPDLNPIEFVWGPMKRRLERRERRSSVDLRAAIAVAWRSLSKLDFKRLYEGCGYA